MTKDEYFDEYARHIADTEFYAQGKEDEFKSVMRRVKKELDGILSETAINSRVRYNAVMKECLDIIHRRLSRYFEKYRESEEERAQKESKFLESLVAAALGIGAVSYLSSLSKVKWSHTGKEGSIASIMESVENKVYRAVATPLQSSYVFGTGASTTMEAVDVGIDKAARGASFEIHTDAAGLQREIQEVMKFGKKVRWQYISMLDTKTCMRCASYSNNIYDSIESAPKVPLHIRCRCYLLPVTEICDEPSYEEWLERQPDSVKYRVLGAARYGFYKSGMRFSEFTSDGRKLTLKELFDR